MAQNTIKQAPSKNDGNGFKTVAFGFDKNDVTMYIGTLRKKIKAMEEEFDQKLSEAVITARNATDSSADSANKAASAVEKDYSEKLRQREATISELQGKLEKLQAIVEAKDAVIESLKARVKDSGSSSHIITESYLDEAAAIINSAFSHLDELSMTSERLKSVLIKNQSLLNEKAKLSPKPEKRSLKDIPLSTLENIMAGSPPEVKNEAPSNATFTSEEDDGIMASIEITPEPVKTEKVKPQSKSEPVLIVKSEPKNAIADEFGSLLADDDIKPLEPEKPGSVSADFDFDLSSLLAGDDSDDMDIEVQEIDEKSEKGSDLGDDLYEMLIDGPTGKNLSEMLAERKKEEKDEELDAMIVPSDEGISVNAIGSGEFDALLAGDSDSSDIDALTASFPASDSDKVFDFAFSDEKNGDDDDMSTDASLSGMM